MELRYQDQQPIRIERADDEYMITIADRHYRARLIHSTPTELIFTVNERLYRAHTADQGNTRFVALDAIVYVLQREDEVNAQTHRRRAITSGDSLLTASMPGQVIKVLVQEGDVVKRGQALVVLEAMKMEIGLTAPQDGSVGRVICAIGDVVERGQTLIELLF